MKILLQMYSGHAGTCAGGSIGMQKLEIKKPNDADRGKTEAPSPGFGSLV
ncbi:MAG: hypothetical protein KF852_08915 [Saprospiraceae bacterium]|nr:hypothetical protein [Saprospiraceae bacterium]